jgi:hypothetical protein
MLRITSHLRDRSEIKFWVTGIKGQQLNYTGNHENNKLGVQNVSKGT